jgi:O-antigen/teichoic acid export membrane protein
MSLAKKTFRGFVLNTASRLTEFALTFAITIVLTRFLGPDNFGKYAIVMTFCGLFALLANVGFEESLNVLIPKSPDDKTKQASLFSSLLGLRVVVLILIAGLAFFISDPISAAMGNPGLGGLIRLAIPFIFIANINALFMFLLTGLFRFGTLAITKILSLLLQLAGILIVFALRGGIAEVIVVLAVVNLILLGIYVIYCRQYLRWRVRDISVFTALSFGLVIWFTNLVNFALGKQSDILLMGLFRLAEAQIGYYEIAYRSVNTINMLLISGFIGITLASFAEASTKDPGLLGNAWQLTIKAYGAIALPVIIFSIVHARTIITGVFSEAYEPAVILFQVYASFIFFTKLLGGGNHITLLYAIGRQKVVLFTRLVAGTGNVGLNLIFIPRLGALGALIATGISQLAVIIIELGFVKKSIKTRFPVIFNVKLTVACLAGIVPGLVFLPYHLWGVVIAAFIYYIIIIVTLYLLKPFSYEDIGFLSSINPLIGKVLDVFAKNEKYEASSRQLNKR